MQTFIELISVAMAAGDVNQYEIAGSYFEIIEAADPVTVELTDRNGVINGSMKNAEESFFIATNYHRITLKSDTAQTVRFGYGSGTVGNRKTAGTVSIVGTVEIDADQVAALTTPTVNTTPMQGDFQQKSVTVAAASTAVFEANAARRYLFIQNKSTSTGNIYINIAGGAASADTGIKIEPGGSYECAGFCPKGAITAITDLSGTIISAVQG